MEAGNRNLQNTRMHYETLFYALFKYWFGNLLEIRLKLTHLRQNLYGSKFSPEGTVISQILSILEYSQLPKQMPDLIYGIRYLRFTQFPRLEDTTGFWTRWYVWFLSRYVTFSNIRIWCASHEYRHRGLNRILGGITAFRELTSGRYHQSLYFGNCFVD